jgi:hypothetical protein
MKAVTTAVVRPDDDRFNDAFHAILREAAERREVRQRLNVQQDKGEAQQAWQDLMSLDPLTGRRS